ncbi:hypothetical protein HYALB_00004869 [Hymenoscyphus albidus]|uniref:Uncharacterized protein n=1 Tax=Hymenoscyphus albidus TaxID=595503 RepID=A0A9N9M0K6_9HELO|nr:hypothetical protein HYALB_00004869 [Hymenoscyphus albidus]
MEGMEGNKESRSFGGSKLCWKAQVSATRLARRIGKGTGKGTSGYDGDRQNNGTWIRGYFSTFRTVILADEV